MRLQEGKCGAGMGAGDGIMADDDDVVMGVDGDARECMVVRRIGKGQGGEVARHGDIAAAARAGFDVDDGVGDIVRAAAERHRRGDDIALDRGVMSRDNLQIGARRDRSVERERCIGAGAGKGPAAGYIDVVSGVEREDRKSRGVAKIGG